MPEAPPPIFRTYFDDATVDATDFWPKTVLQAVFLPLRQRNGESDVTRWPGYSAVQGKLLRAPILRAFADARAPDAVVRVRVRERVRVTLTLTLNPLTLTLTPTLTRCARGCATSRRWAPSTGSSPRTSPHPSPRARPTWSAPSRTWTGRQVRVRV